MKINPLPVLDNQKSLSIFALPISNTQWRTCPPYGNEVTENAQVAELVDLPLPAGRRVATRMPW